MQALVHAEYYADKPLDRMDLLADMAHFPAMVNAGASGNVLITLLVTWWLVPRYPQIYAPVVWRAFVLAVNLTPVALLRAITFNRAPVRPLSKMDFWRDQHRFSDWVCLAASQHGVLGPGSEVALCDFACTGDARLGIGHCILRYFSPVLLRSRAQ